MPSEEITHLVENSFVSEELAVVAFGPCTAYKRRWAQARCREERPRLPCGRQQWPAAAPLQAAAAPVSPAGGASGKTCEGRAESPWGFEEKMQEAVLQTSRSEGGGAAGDCPRGSWRGPWQSKGGEQGDRGSQVTPLQIDHNPLFPVPLWLLG